MLGNDFTCDFKRLTVRFSVAAPLVAFVWLSLAPAQAKEDQSAMLTDNLEADRIVVLKGERRLVLMRDDRMLRVYNVALGRYPKGHKQRKGDAKTPEGIYTIDYRIDSNKSKFYRALHISYPNDRDKARAEARGVNPGGQIMIHGLPNNWTAKQLDHPRLDWTQGCIAVTNREIDEIWAMVRDGTTIEIHP